MSEPKGCYASITVGGKPCIIHKKDGPSPGSGVPVWMCECGRKCLNNFLNQVVEHTGDVIGGPMIKNDEVVKGFIMPTTRRYEPPPQAPKVVPAWEINDELEQLEGKVG